MEELRLDIAVNDTHIRVGKGGDCGLCPVALALIDALSRSGRRDWRVDVNPDRILIGPRKDALPTHRVDTPVIIREFVFDFDIGIPVSPFSCPLDFKSLEVA